MLYAVVNDCIGLGTGGAFLAPCEPRRGVELLTRWRLPGGRVVRGALLGWLYPVALIETGGVGMVGNSPFLVGSSVQCLVVYNNCSRNLFL